MATQAQQRTLSQIDWRLLLLPTAAGFFFGLGPFLLGGNFGVLFGYAGNDAFLYRLAGAATFGYGVALALGIRQQSWSAVRLPVIATLTFNIASIFACVMEYIGGNALFLVFLVNVASILFIVITVRLLMRYSNEPRPTPDVSQRQRYALVLGGILAAAFGVAPLLLPQLSQLVGYKGTDVFIIRQAGAASLGYAVMAIFALRSGAWAEIRGTTIMALIFNGFSFLASAIAVISGDPNWIVWVIGAASLLYTVIAFVGLQRKGQL